MQRCVRYVRESRVWRTERVGSEKREQEGETMGAEDVHNMQNPEGLRKRIRGNQAKAR